MEISVFGREWTRRGRGWVRVAPMSAVALAALAVGASATQAQSFDLGVGTAFYVDAPDPFVDELCDQRPLGLTGTGAWRALSWLVLEANASVNGDPGSTTCAVYDIAPIPFEVPIVQTSYPDGIYGSGFLTTHVAVLIEPFPRLPASPRARLGLGRIWDKDVSHRVWGLGVRYRFGRHSLVTDVDQWRFSVEETVSTVIYHADAPPDIVSTETVERAFRPLAVRIGWEIAVGR